LEFREKLKEVSNYKDSNFHDANSIGVIGRGPSVYRLDLCYKKFNHCYLSGEFNNTLQKMGRYIQGKEIVLCIMQQQRYRTSKENCKKFDIKNIQVRYQEATRPHRKCISSFPDLRVVGFTKKHYEIVASINKALSRHERSIFSTGLSGIISALYFDPKDIYVIGLDFYNRSVKPYFVKEDKDVAHAEHIYNSIKGLRAGMLESIKIICDLFPNINMHVYTTYDGIKSRNNLHVTYV